MQDSLLNRFQGGLLGAWLGASWNKANHKLLPINEQLLPWINWGTGITNWGAELVAHSIIDSSELSEKAWLESVERQSEQLKFPESVESKFPTPKNSAIIALATLSLTLFFHDRPAQFKEYIYSINKTWQQSPETLEEVILWQDAIALILREKLNSHSFIPQLLERHSNTATVLGQQLKQVQTFLAEKMPLQQAVSQLSRREPFYLHEIALACYCFAYTPQELSLAIKRAKNIHYQSSLTAALTGILTGVYNGVSGTPIAWRLQLENAKIWEKIYQQATYLLAIWSGVSQPGSFQPLQHTAIASPFIIQPRLAFKMSSQKKV